MEIKSQEKIILHHFELFEWVCINLREKNKEKKKKFISYLIKKFTRNDKE